MQPPPRFSPRPRPGHGLRFDECYIEGEHGQFVRSAAKLGSYGGSALLVDQPAGHYTTAGTDDLVMCAILGDPVAAAIDFGAGMFRFQSAHTPFFLSPARAPSVFAVENPHLARLIAVPIGEERELLGRHGLRADAELEPLYAGGFEDPFLASLMPQLGQSLTFEGETGLLIQDSLLVTIILALQQVGCARRTARPTVVGGLSPAMIRKATAFLMDGIGQPKGLKALAEHCGMSEFHFHRAFTLSFGCSPHRWQLQRRMEMACELLRLPGTSVMEVAIAVGYDTPQGLARVFRRHFGCTPMEYRRALQ